MLYSRSRCQFRARPVSPQKNFQDPRYPPHPLKSYSYIYSFLVQAAKKAISVFLQFTMPPLRMSALLAELEQLARQQAMLDDDDAFSVIAEGYLTDGTESTRATPRECVTPFTPLDIEYYLDPTSQCIWAWDPDFEDAWWVAADYYTDPVTGKQWMHWPKWSHWIWA